MVQPCNCPENWEYEQKPNHHERLWPACRQLVMGVRHHEIDAMSLVADSRFAHHAMFKDLTPPFCDYFAGHYRGENFTCLKHYRCGIPGNPYVGAAPEHVCSMMVRLAELAKTTLEQVDVNIDTPQAPEDRLKYVVKVVCPIFDLFLRIHPYANGNGHVARLLLLALFERYGYRVRNFDVHPKPGPNSPFSKLIRDYQGGNRFPLEEWLTLGVASSFA